MSDPDWKKCRVPVGVIQHIVCEWARIELKLPELADGRQYGVMLEFVVEGRNPNGTPNAIAADVGMHVLPAGTQVGKGGKA